MQHQGLTVVRQTPEELRQLWGNPYRPTPAVAVAVPTPTPVRLDKSRFPKAWPAAGNRLTFLQDELHDFSHRAAEHALEQERPGGLVREARAARIAALPALGQRVRLPSGQIGVVIAFLTFKDWEKAGPA